MKKLSIKNDTTDWECDWEGAVMTHLRHDIKMPFREKLEWLEEAEDLVEKFKNAKTVSKPF